MRVALDGINRVRKRLANGTLETYHYYGKGGPRIVGKFGSAEFLASYAEARKRLSPSRSDTLRYVLDEFSASPDFAGLAPRTRKDYSKLLFVLEEEFGDLPLGALEDRRMRGDILAWRDRLRNGRSRAIGSAACFAR